jgi:hypothetical protein
MLESTKSIFLQATNRVPCDATSLKKRVKRKKFSTLFNNHLVRVKNLQSQLEDFLEVLESRRKSFSQSFEKVKIQFVNVEQ